MQTRGTGKVSGHSRGMGQLPGQVFEAAGAVVPIRSPDLDEPPHGGMDGEDEEGIAGDGAQDLRG